MNRPYSRSRAASWRRFPASRVLLAFAACAALLAACQLPAGRSESVEARGELPGASRQVTLGQGLGAPMAAAPSPDGKRIVFTAHGGLWVAPVGGGQAKRITGWRFAAAAPVWSPDGRMIAFQNYGPEGSYHLWTIEPDGRHATEVTTGPFDDREPGWFPDGSGLVFASDRSEDGQYKIWKLALNGGKGREPEQITTGPGAEGNPVVSPDGTRLAYSEGANVLTLTLAGGAPKVLAQGAAPAWTPDGVGLVYQDEKRQLVAGGAPVTAGEDVFPFPVRFLPDGRFLYTADGQIRIRDANGANPAVVEVRADPEPGAGF